MHDLINGSLEWIGSFVIFLSIREVLREKMVSGISWWHTSFFTVWGLWNLAYYPALDQWWSFSGAIALVIMNTIWLALIIHYKRLQNAAARPTT